MKNNFLKMKKTALHRLSFAAATLIWLCFSSSEVSAQDLNSAYFIDNYTYSYRLNPAFTTKKNFVGGLLSNVNAGTYSNIGISTLFYPYEGQLATFMHKSVDKEEFLGKLKDKNRINVNASYNIASTGFWTNFKGKKIFQTFELNLRSNSAAKIPYNLFKFLKGGSEDDFFYDLSHVSAYTQTYLEAAAGTSTRFGNLEVGARAKFLVGTNKMYMNIKQMYASLDGFDWSFHSKAVMTGAGGGIKRRMKEGSMGGYEAVDFNGIKYRPLGLGGLGGAIDIGARYQVNEYINVSASINDLGVIFWRNRVVGYNDGSTWIVSVDDIALDDVGGLGDVIEGIIDKVESVYEFLPDKKNFTTQSLPINFNAGAEFKMPFYKKMSIGLLGSFRSSHLTRYNEFRISLNATPLKWLSLSLNTAYTTFGWQLGGMVNVYAKKFSAFLGTDSHYYHMTPQLLPVNEFNTHVVFGVNYLLTRNPWIKRSRQNR